jgi:alkylated DNA repair dioxygenase AlkB
MNNKTFSLTFGDVAENHKGMQKIGTLSSNGFNLEDLNHIKTWFEEKGCKCNIVDLHLLLDKNLQKDNSAYLLVVKNAVNVLLDDETGKEQLFNEQDVLKKDTKAFMYGRVVNKHARHNLCFSDFSQEPDYENKKGTVYNFKDLPLLNEVRNEIGKLLNNEKFKETTSLQCEGNYYYDLQKCGIGFHGDSERRKVIGVRLGAAMPLHFQWYKNGEAVGTRLMVPLEGGDLYIMNEKAVGTDWKSKKIFTLRHATGCKKFTEI